jgi:hypothetical protein
MICVQACPSKLRSKSANTVIDRDNKESANAMADNVAGKTHG